MKHLTLGLVLSAVPTASLGQAVSCPDCRHVASYFKGEGGFIGTVADGAAEVVFVASCGSVSITGEVLVDDGTAALLFTGRNGLACDQDGGSLEIAGLEDGGWYWITDVESSAVGNLVSKDVLDNERVKLTSAGEGVSMAMGMGAVFMKETSSGRVGILPNILPEPPMEALRKCGFDFQGTVGTDAAATADQANARYTRRTSGCEMGDGKTITLATTTNTFTGARVTIPDKGTVVRPGGTGSVVVTIDLWGNGSGHFTTAADGHALHGQPAAAATDAGRGYRLTGVTYTAELGTGPSGVDLATGTKTGGITMDTTTTTNAVTFTIEADTEYCRTRPTVRNNSATVTVTAAMSDASSVTQVTPSVARSSTATGGVVGGTSFTVVCGS